ncbi:MAG: glycoside hydrolase family 3 C-terminal domain-containing protein, partial [Treponema sp.]|nr:glycoside hydrolase family 3 C-terminal domain-containing protein [Treponema sp.]
ALELALDSAVLLKNDGILPLKYEKAENDADKNNEDKNNAGGAECTSGNSRTRLIAIGTFARDVRFQGGGSSHICTKKYPNIIEELSQDFGVEYEQNYNQNALELVKRVVAENPEVPVVYFCGLPDSSEGEGFDRTDLSLPLEQVELYEQICSLTKNIVLVTFGGSPFDLSFALESENQARAILHMYLCGQACAKACAMLLTGKSNPCGKLAETWPLENDYIKPSENYDINYEEGVLVGYRYYETKNCPVLFEFGYGLSYTNFEYSDLRVENCGAVGTSECAGIAGTVISVNHTGIAGAENVPVEGAESPLYKISVSVQNVGAVPGAEIVQLYVKNPSSEEISRPSIELRDFAKIFLQPGEKQTVTFTLTNEAFSVYSDKFNSFRIVGGEYQICIGSSIRKLKLTKKVNVHGEPLENLVSPDSVLQEKAFAHHERHHKGNFDGSDSLGYMAAQSNFINGLLKILRFFLVATSKSKSAEDPAVKIMIRGLEENPLESFISTAPGIFGERLVNFLVKRANAGGRAASSRESRQKK